MAQTSVKSSNIFEGKSALRQADKQIQPKSEQQKALEEYLKKYQGGGGKEEKLKRKKKRAKSSTGQGGVRIVDLDSSGFHAAPAARKEDDVEDEEGPLVANPEEAEIALRLEEKIRTGEALSNWQTLNASPSGQADLEDASPPRRVRHDTPDGSPPRRARHDTPDVSPPRRHQRDTSDISPLRRRRHDTPDVSPPRNRRHDTLDVSPLRRGRHDTPDASPQHKHGRGDPGGDLSPPRRGAGAVTDMSPPRRHAQGDAGDLSPPRKPVAGEAGPTKKRKLMSDGTASGMISAQDLQRDMDLKRAAERKRFEALEAQSSGRNAQTVYRDRATGKQVDQEALLAAQRAEAEKKKAQHETPQWGGGLKQMRERAGMEEDMRREAAKPFARTADDVDAELSLRDRVRFGDPMAHLAKKKTQELAAPIVPAHMAKQMKKSGFIIPQEVPPHSWLRRNLGPPPNRYGIRPGRHWDGRDRSTGFEKEMFKRRAALASRGQEAHMWSQADM